LTTRINASEFKKPIPNKPIYTGQLFDCDGCGRCNLCKYKMNAQTTIKNARDKMKKRSNSPMTRARSEKIDDRKKEIDKNDSQFF
jgi:hypothetical protein